MTVRERIRAFLVGGGLALALAVAGIVGAALTAGAEGEAPGTAAGEPAPTVVAQAGDEETPRGAIETGEKSDGWRAVREGVEGSVSIPDRRAAVLVQSEGEIWRSVRNGPLMEIGAWTLLGMIALLAVFYAVRGRIRLSGPAAGRDVVRFRFLDRFAHWLAASSFVVLALTGLNLLYGRDLLIPVVGKEAFAVVAEAGKLLHNFVAFPFMVGIALMLVLWIRDNLPSRADLAWLARGGGMLSRSASHPPAHKFNAGQKAVFWIVVLGGFSVSLSGIALLFPFSIRPFGGTFELLNLLGLGLPEALTPMEEMQLAHVWHAIVSLGMIAVILAHIYIGTLGMEGAFRAMGSGKVDAAWARQHHSHWDPEEEDEAAAAPRPEEQEAG